MKYWEIIADNLKKAGWSLGWVSAVGSRGRTIWRIATMESGLRLVVLHFDHHHLDGVIIHINIPVHSVGRIRR